jgi:hypothetical protein
MSVLRLELEMDLSAEENFNKVKNTNTLQYARSNFCFLTSVFINCRPHTQLSHHLYIL